MPTLLVSLLVAVSVSLVHVLLGSSCLYKGLLWSLPEMRRSKSPMFVGYVYNLLLRIIYRAYIHSEVWKQSKEAWAVNINKKNQTTQHMRCAQRPYQHHFKHWSPSWLICHFSLWFLSLSSDDATNNRSPSTKRLLRIEAATEAKEPFFLSLSTNF